MGIRPGYKQTEIGVIPEDWKIDYIGNHCSITTGKRNTQDSEVNGVYPFFVRSQVVEHINSYSFDGEAVLTAGDGVGTGKVFHYINGRFDLHQRVYCLRDFSNAVDGYYFFLFFKHRFFARIQQFTAKTSVDSVRLEMISKMPIALPPREEQIAISKALSGIDSLITSLEKLIEKKKLIKQGVMQELLTGKRRLPGFSGEWETKRLGDLFSLQYGKPMKESDRVESGVIPVYGSNGVVGYTFTELTSCPTIIVGRKGAAGSVHHSPTGCWPIDTTFYIEFDDYTESLFYYYLLQCAGLDRIKSDSAVPGLNRADAYALMITVPSKEERIQIAEILLSIDQEITYLTNSLDKHKLLKQAMMQELLTGRIRLI